MNIIEKIKHLNNQVYSVIHGKMVQVIPNGATIEFTLLTNHVRSSKQMSSTIVQVSLMKNGALQEEGECLIFPSKENRDWNSIKICPFKKGDLVAVRDKDVEFYQLRYHSGERNLMEHDLVYTNQEKHGVCCSYSQCISIADFLKL